MASIVRIVVDDYADVLVAFENEILFIILVPKLRAKNTAIVLGRWLFVF